MAVEGDGFVTEARRTAKIVMPAYLLQTHSSMPLDVWRVFTFFRDARNLDRIVPPWWSRDMQTEGPHDLRPGSMLTYRRRLFGLRVRWQTEITMWNPPHQFVEEQRSGPYEWWVHTHTFTPIEDGGTAIEDEVNYSPRGGALRHGLILAPDLRRVFRARDRALREALGLQPTTSNVRIRIGRAK